MKKRFTAMAILGGGAALAIAGLVSHSAPRAADEPPALLASLEGEVASHAAPPYFRADSAVDAGLLAQSYSRTVTVGPGDTLMNLLVDAGADRGDAHYAILAMSALFKPRHLKPGHEIEVTLRPGTEPDSPDSLVSMTLAESVERDVRVIRDAEGYRAESIDHPLTVELAAATGEIRDSLFLAGEAAGVPLPVLADLIQVYSFDVDFQRDIRSGDEFTILYEQYIDENGIAVRTGNILRASMTLSGKERTLYRYQTADGTIDYFDETGKSARRALMRTPINGARLSSGFGSRRHPILGFTKLHTGTDFAAPPGTPIYAAGSGVVEHAGRKGGYGIYVRIRHNGTYKTAYAHMSGIARGVRGGTRVQQGQVIGYVGSTGRSTGPHLHYEVIRNGSFINSRSMHLPSGKALKGDDLEAFELARAEAERQFAELTGSTVQFAATESPAAEGCGRPDSVC